MSLKNRFSGFDWCPKLLILSATMIAFGVLARGQPATDAGTATSTGEVIEVPGNEFGVWGGSSLKTTTFHIFAGDGGFDLLRLGYTRALHKWNSATLKYTFDVVPVAVLSYWTEANPGLVPACIAYGNCSSQDATLTRAHTYGAGLSPIGFQVNFRSHRKAQPFLDTSGGFILFPKPVPDARGEKFNFTLDFGGGVQIFSGAKHAITLGYRYHHLSNGYRGQINPGFDSNVFYVGFSFFK